MTLTTAKVIERIRAGERLHMQFTGGKSVWWFEQPHQVVPIRTVAAVLAAPDSPLREAGDSLFGLPMNSQTWLAPASPLAREDRQAPRAEGDRLAELGEGFI